MRRPLRIIDAMLSAPGLPGFVEAAVRIGVQVGVRLGSTLLGVSPPRGRSRSRRGPDLFWPLAVLALAGAIGCSVGPYDMDQLEREHPALGAVSQHRLSDVTPYLLPAGGSVAFFLCRWPADAPIPVSLPPDASAEERRGLESVLRAWEGAGLGVRFTTAGVPGAGIEIRFIDPEAGATATAYAANTIADCAVAPEALAMQSANVLPAKLVFASIHLWRGGFDRLGRPDPHSQDEFIGSALHEFGHALGYQGHASVGRTIMVKETDATRWAARSVLKGEPFSDHTLRALYALPSGTVIKRVTIAAYRTDTVDRMAQYASERGLAGPFVRVGDLDGFLAWRGETGHPYVMQVRDVRKVLRDPDTLWVQVPLAVSELLDAD